MSAESFPRDLATIDALRAEVRRLNETLHNISTHGYEWEQEARELRAQRLILQEQSIEKDMTIARQAGRISDLERALQRYLDGRPA